jgi:Flp pilus assembly protein TadG
VVDRFADTRRTRNQRGTSVLEMAIVLPVLLTVTFAIGDFGIAYTRWNSLTNAVREGARAGVVFRQTCDTNTVAAEIEAVVADFAESSGLDVSTLSTTATGACGGTGSQLAVEATAPHSYLAMSALAGLGADTDLRARTVMRNE